MLLSKDEARLLLKKYISNKNLLKHMYATEAVMAELAEHFGEDINLWAQAGLLHDIDYDETKDEPKRHSLVGAEILEKYNLPEELIYAVKCHNDAHLLERKSLLDKALYSVDPTTGLIVAGALIKTEKSLEAIDVSFLLNRMAEKTFARGANREQIRACTELGLELEEFLEIALRAMKKISKDLGL